MATHNALGVYGGLITGAVACAGLVLLAFLVIARTRRIRVAGPAATAERQFRRRVTGVLVELECLLALSFGWTSLLAVVGPPGLVAHVVVLAATLSFVALSVGMLMTAGQGGTPLAGSNTLNAERDQPVGDRTDDAYWKAGVFYVNRDDPSFLVEKRFGIGYTVNLGHPAAWLLLAALVLVPIVLSLVRR